MNIVSAYAQFTQEIVNVTGMTRPMLHMHAGMAIYLLSQFALGTRRGSFLAIMLVLQAELFNELMNKLYNRTWRWPDTREDIALTLFWPIMCYLVSKYRRWRWAKVRSTRRARLERVAAARAVLQLTPAK
jgi:hypothetical protein